MDAVEKRVNDYLQEGKEQEAIALLEGLPEVCQNENYLLLLGQLYYKIGNHSKALNYFNAVLRINAGNRKAAVYVEMIREVMNFYYKDRYNP